MSLSVLLPQDVANPEDVDDVPLVATLTLLVGDGALAVDVPLDAPYDRGVSQDITVWSGDLREAIDGLNAALPPFLAMREADVEMAPAAWSLIAHALAVGGVYKDAVTDPADTTGADLIVMAVGQYAGATLVTPFDSRENIAIQGPSVHSGESMVTLWYMPAPTVGPDHAFTAPATTDGYQSIAVAAFSGPASALFDQESTGATSAELIQTGSITPTVSNELIVSGWSAGDGNSGTLLIDGNFSITDNVNFTVGVTEGVGLAYLIQDVAAEVDPTWSWTGTAAASTVIASFKGA